MRFRIFVAAVIVTAAVFGVANTKPAHAEESNAQTNTNTAQDTEPEKKIVVVEKGDYLVKIAKKNDTTFTRIFYANKDIEDPDLIYPGQKLRIPHENEKLKKRVMPDTETVRAAVAEEKSNTPKQQPASTAAPVASGSVWDKLAACESGGNWAINTGNGYYGGLQFSLSTWRSVGGSGYPHQASRAEQIKRGKILQARSGWGQWPACTAKLGLR